MEVQLRGLLSLGAVAAISTLLTVPEFLHLLHSTPGSVTVLPRQSPLALPIIISKVLRVKTAILALTLLHVAEAHSQRLRLSIDAARVIDTYGIRRVILAGGPVIDRRPVGRPERCFLVGGISADRVRRLPVPDAACILPAARAHPSP